MKTPTILVVEDEAIIARDIRQQLVELGYEVAGHTATAEEAIVLTGTLKPDLLLMDIHLAGQMDGIEAAQVIRKQFGTPVVFLTAFAGTETLERAKLTDPFGYIIKPFDDRYLQTVIEMALYKHRAETHLRRAYDETATILRTALDAFFMTDWQGRLLDVNESSCRMLGYTREELLTMSLPELQVGTDPAAVAGAGNQKPPEPTRFEGPQRCKDGRTIYVEMSVNYMPHNGGRIFAFARDVTERKMAEEALIRLNEELETRVATRTQDLEAARKDAEKANRAKATFLATMTHELRTPLNGIIGTLEAIRQTNLERDQIEMMDLVGESALSLLTIVDDILDFSKIEAGRLGIELVPMSPQDVVEKACAVVGPMANKAGVELTLFTDPRIPHRVLGDATRLKQVLLNLGNNAVKFSSQQERRSQVSIRAVLKHLTQKAASVEFEIKDNGIGMDVNTLAGLFKSFTQGDPSITRRFGGTGLGLAISKNLVELMGGEISVSSDLGRGSTFRVLVTFDLPTEKTTDPPSGELTDVPCLVIAGPEGLQRDLAAYLDAAGASVEHVPDLPAARLRAGTQGRRGPSVWIFDIHGEAPAIETLRAAAHERPDQDIRFVLVGRGRRRKPRPIAEGVVVIDANVLKRDTFVTAVSQAAGRSQPESVGVALPRRAPAGPPPRDEARKRRQLILVAEDNEVNQKVIRRQLGLLGYAADVASSGKEALQMWGTGDYALLLADLHMPEMDGYQLTAAIRAQEGAEQHGVIIALTADVLKGGAQQCRDAGMDDYLCKPARLSELRGMFEKWLPARRAETSSAGSSKPASTDRPVDITVLEDLVGRDPDVIREFLRAFWISTAKTTAELLDAYQWKDLSRVADLAHKMKSPARSVGALQLADLCEELERAAKGSDFAAIEACLPRFEAERSNVESYLQHT